MELNAISSISKPKLPKNYSYVLHSSQLNDLLISGGNTIHTDLVYWLPQVIGSIFEAQYWRPNSNIPYPRLYVRAGALLKGDIQNARRILSGEVFPKFSIWLEDIQKHEAGLKYSLESLLYFNAVYEDNKIRIFGESEF